MERKLKFQFIAADIVRVANAKWEDNLETIVEGQVCGKVTASTKGTMTQV